MRQQNGFPAWVEVDAKKFTGTSLKELQELFASVAAKAGSLSEIAAERVLQDKRGIFKWHDISVPSSSFRVAKALI